MKNDDFQRPDTATPVQQQSGNDLAIKDLVQTSLAQPVLPLPTTDTKLLHTSPERAHMPLRHRLSSKLLLMIVLAVLIAEVIILVPSIANMRNQWLSAKHMMIATSSILLAADNPENALPPEIQAKLLQSTGTIAITVSKDGASRVLASSTTPVKIDQYVDLANTNPLRDFWDALVTLTTRKDRVLMISGPAGYNGATVDVVLHEKELQDRLMHNSRIIAIVSLLISLLAAALIYFIIHCLLLRPVGHMYMNMISFAQKPDDPGLIIEQSTRNDEMGAAQNRLAVMQGHMQHLFHERKHLADLGLAVSKINHDMRNILASAQLMSDSLADTKDPVVQRFAPKLIRTLNRAISYAETVITYGRTQEAAPVRLPTPLRPLIDDMKDMLAIPKDSQIEFCNDVPEDFYADLDQEQMLRVLTNLCRNSIQAMSLHAGTGQAMSLQTGTVLDMRIKRLTITAGRIGTTAIIAVADTGPGLSKKARDNLFMAFHGSTRSGGTGLGLVIAQELVRAHGGSIELRDEQNNGAVFEIRIPDQPAYFSQLQRQSATLA